MEVVYDYDLVEGMSFDGPKGDSIGSLKSKLAFVAIKNGKDEGIGYIFSNLPMELPKKIPLGRVYDLINKTAILE